MNDVLTPEEYAQLISLGGENSALDEQLLQQMMQARAMQGQMPSTQQYGRIAVPPNIVNLIGELAKVKTSQDWLNAADKTRVQRNTNTMAQNNKILEAILRAKQTPPIAGGTGLQPPRPRSPYDLSAM